MLMRIHKFLTFSCHLLKVNHSRWIKEKRSFLRTEHTTDYCTCHIYSIPQISCSPSIYPLHIQSTCFDLTKLQPHFPYQYYLCHFDKHRRRVIPCRRPQIWVASGFYSSYIFFAGAQLRLDVMSRCSQHNSVWVSTLDRYWYWSTGWHSCWAPGTRLWEIQKACESASGAKYSRY